MQNKEVRIYATADGHGGCNLWGKSDPLTGRSMMVDNFASRIEETVCDILTVNPDVWIFAGDIYHSPSPSNYLREIIGNAVRRVRAAGINVVFIPGNHDGTSSHGTRHALADLTPLQDMRFYVVDKPQMVSNISKSGVQYQIACVPWMKNPEDMRNALKSLARKVDPTGVVPTYMTGHFTVNGSVSGSEKLFSLSSPNGIERELLKPFRFCFLGDIHKPQMIGDNAMYIGSLDRVDFSERDDEKGSILFVDTNPENSALEYTAERRASNAQKFVQIDVDLIKSKSAKTSLDKIEKEEVQGSVVKVVIRCMADQRRMIVADGIQSALYKAGALFVMPLKLDVVKNEEERKESRVVKETSVLDALKVWLESRELTPEIKQAVLVEGEKMLLEAKS